MDVRIVQHFSKFCRRLRHLKVTTLQKNVHRFSRNFSDKTDLTEDVDRSEPTAKISTFGDYHRLLNYDFEHVDEEKVEATVGHPGFTYADYDINAQPKIWMILNILEAARFFAHHYSLDENGRTFRDYAKLTSDRMIFLVTSEIRMTKELYDHSVQKFPFKIRIEGGHIGNTSLNSISTIYTKEDIKLVRNVNQVVSINKSSRRPLPLPDWWKSKYAESSKRHSVLKVHKFEIPTGNTGFYQQKIAWSDTDMNKHTNWGTYTRFCVDAAHHCARKGSLKYFEENLKNGANLVQCYFYGECVEGDLLDIYCWEDSNDSKKLYFDVHKGQHSIMQCQFVFF